MTKARSRYVRNKDWDRYKHIVQKFLEDDAGRQTIGWCRHIDQPLFMGEDVIPEYTLIPIEALCYYNAFRNWPINKATVAGELDDENLVILIPKSSIKPYLNSFGYFKFNWSEDRFIINGITYKPSGDTEVAQAKDEPVVFQIILKRDIDFNPLPNSVNNAFAGSEGRGFCCKEGHIFAGKPEEYDIFVSNTYVPYKDKNGVNINEKEKD